jgi:hypothetical protein
MVDVYAPLGETMGRSAGKRTKGYNTNARPATLRSMGLSNRLFFFRKEGRKNPRAARNNSRDGMGSFSLSQAISPSTGARLPLSRLFHRSTFLLGDKIMAALPKGSVVAAATVLTVYEFAKVDKFFRRRLRAVLLRRNNRRGWGKSLEAHRRWPNAYFAKIGLHHARSLVSSVPIPMRKLSTGEQCAGEPHARFGGRGEPRGSFPPLFEDWQAAKNQCSFFLMLIRRSALN